MLNKDQTISDLISRNDELENYFKNTIIPQLFIDAKFTLRKFTPPTMKQFSLSYDDIGRPLEEIKDNFRFPSIIENIQQVFDTNEILEKEIQTIDKRWYQMNILPYVKFETNKTDGVIITFVEITMRIKDLREQEKLIADYETVLDTISHDIKSPLTSMLLTTSHIRSSLPSSSQNIHSLFNILESAIKKMQQLLADLTDSRKLEYKNESQVELLSFENIIEDVRLTHAGLIQDSGTVIKTEINVSEIEFSRRKLRSIIFNLLSNSIKFRSTDRCPEILIKTEKSEDGVIITVKDNGIGIPADKKEAIFKKYYRMENAIEGSGIGLYLVREMVNSTGGTISVESTVHKGSEFKINLSKQQK